MRVWRIENTLISTQFVSAERLDTIRISTGGIINLYDLFWGVSSKYLGTILGSLSVLVTGSVYRWFNYFSVVGYNYNIRANKGRRLISLYVGLIYRICIRVPAQVKFLVGKRKMFIVSEDLVLLNVMGHFVRNLRNLLPYGDRGIVYRNERPKFKAVKKK